MRGTLLDDELINGSLNTLPAKMGKFMGVEHSIPILRIIFSYFLTAPNEPGSKQVSSVIHIVRSGVAKIFLVLLDGGLLEVVGWTKGSV